MVPWFLVPPPKKLKNKMSERAIEYKLKKGVEAFGGMCLKFPPIFFRGFPDRIILMPGGHVLFVETKAPKRRPSIVQKKVHQSLRDLGFRVEVIDSMEDVETLLTIL